jgi:hypothetical protein
VVILGVRDHLELTTREQRAREVAASESRE